MTTSNTPRSYALENLLRCHHCESPMQLDFAPHPTKDMVPRTFTLKVKILRNEWFD